MTVTLRATGEVGVVLLPQGPGATNCIAGIATAYVVQFLWWFYPGKYQQAIGDDASETIVGWFHALL
ncbi:thiamine pyrophosphate-binding protein (plasmid) [Pseudoalteromonas espejiana]